MPITHNLTKQENSLVSFIRRNIKTFSKAKKAYETNSQVPDFFKEIVEKLYEFSNYNRKYDLAVISFMTSVTPRYIEEETEDIGGQVKMRTITKTAFQTYLNNCNDDSQYLYFRFTNLGNHFNLGYVDKNCNTPACSFIGSNIDGSEDGGVYEDSKRKKGVIHTKTEFTEFMKGVADNGSVYIHKKQYKTGKGGSKLPKHTVVLSNNAVIANSSKIENQGGACCPPQLNQ